jgi:2-keto-4-pentenoate hydratase/2-oxohepta-3-ene-1,7-dioic acid hydratase in catechol pathway
MKLASYLAGAQAGFGFVTGDGIIDLVGQGVGRSLKHALQANSLSRIAELGATLDVNRSTDDVTFLPCIPNPGKVFCIGVNYRKHVLEMGRELPDKPWVFTRTPDSFVGHDGKMLRPSVSEQFDFEGELAVVIGETAHRVTANDAFNYVAGYCCLNDGSIRDYQRHSGQFTAGKNFYHSGSLGPWLVTSDEISDPAALDIQTRLNGEVMQASPTSDLIFDIPALIEYCSTFARLEPGDIIATGTPGGVGAARTPPVWLQDGDTIEIEISKIGTLRNAIADEDSV